MRVAGLLLQDIAQNRRQFLGAGDPTENAASHPGPDIPGNLGSLVGEHIIALDVGQRAFDRRGPRGGIDFSCRPGTARRDPIPSHWQ